MILMRHVMLHGSVCHTRKEGLPHNDTCVSGHACAFPQCLVLLVLRSMLSVRIHAYGAQFLIECSKDVWLRRDSVGLNPSLPHSTLPTEQMPRRRSSRMHGDERIAVLALGTRGDVQPLAVLAAELQRQRPAVQTHLITHGDHQVPIYCVSPDAKQAVALRIPNGSKRQSAVRQDATLIGRKAMLQHHQRWVEVHFSSRTVVTVQINAQAWLKAFIAAGVRLHALASAPARLWHSGGDGGGSPAAAPLDSAEAKEELVLACEAALGRTVGEGSAVDLMRSATVESMPTLPVCRARAPSLIYQRNLTSATISLCL